MCPAWRPGDLARITGVDNSTLAGQFRTKVIWRSSLQTPHSCVLKNPHPLSLLLK